MYKFNTY